jgi:hypothetical protein
MKTLKLISFSICLLAVATIASAKETTKLLITSPDDLRNSFREIIESDFSDYGNYFYKNDVDKLDGKVEVFFYIMPDQSVKILSVKSKSPVASEYIKQLLDKEKMNFKPEMIGKKYRVGITLIYKAV